MKKNLRIVSAAAAALLAVAPVAATVVPAASTVSAAVKEDQVKAGAKLTLNADVRAFNPKTSHYNGIAARKGDKVTVSAVTKDKQLAVLSNNKVVKVSELAANSDETPAPAAPTQNGSQSATVKNNGTKIFNYTNNKFEDAKSTLPVGSTLTVSQKVYRQDGKAYYAILNSDGKATGQFVLVSDVTVAPDDKGSENIVPSDNIFNSIFENDPNVAVNISATASQDRNGAQINWYSTLNGQLIYTDAKGASHTALLHGNENTVVYRAKTGERVTDHLVPGRQYVADFKDVTLNLGNAAAGTSVKFVLPRTARFVKGADKTYNNVKTVNVDSNGIADLGEIKAQFYAYDPTDLQEVHFYSEKTGNVVTSGNINLHAVNGKLGLYSLFHAMNQEYVAAQLDGGKHATYASRTDMANFPQDMLPVAVQNDLRDQLKKQNITVDDNGYFTAPASFTLNMNAKSIYNGATATLPVTVTVDNVTPTAANETTKNVTIMHIATIYDKNGKATHEPALRAYNSVSVVSDPVSLKDEKGNDAGKFYKLAGKDQYIKVGNVDGTSRSLKHNSYVYKSTGKRNGKKVLKKGSSVTTYGKSFMIAGHQMYRIGKNQYVKKANF